MTEDAFEGLLTTIIDTHREAAATRRKWRYAAFAGIASFIFAAYLIH